MKTIQDGQIEKLPKGKGFYITLSVCLVAIFAAGWSAYRNIKELSEFSKSEQQEQLGSKNQNIVHRSTKSEEVSNNETVEKDNFSRNENKASSYIPKNNNIAVDEAEEDDEEDVQSVLSDGTENLIIYPSNNSVIKEFSDGKPIYSKTLGDWRVHDGIDLKADKGSMVKAITSGTVKDVYNDPSYGMTIVIQHDPGFVAYYSGLGNTTLVKKDDKVNPGDDIGSINDVPIEISEGPHLHLMINQDGKFIDPILILEKDSE